MVKLVEVESSFGSEFQGSTGQTTKAERTTAMKFKLMIAAAGLAAATATQAQALTYQWCDYWGLRCCYHSDGFTSCAWFGGRPMALSVGHPAYGRLPKDLSLTNHLDTPEAQQALIQAKYKAAFDAASKSASPARKIPNRR